MHGQNHIKAVWMVINIYLVIYLQTQWDVSVKNYWQV